MYNIILILSIAIASEVETSFGVVQESNEGEICSPGCPTQIIGDGKCDAHCLNDSC